MILNKRYAFLAEENASPPAAMTKEKLWGGSLSLLQITKAEPLDILLEEPKLVCLKGRTAVTDFYTNLIETEKSCPAFLDFLEGSGYTRVSGAGKIIGWKEFRHIKTNGLLYFPEAEVGIHNPWYSWKSIRSSVSRTLRKMESIDFHAVCEFILTFPKEVSLMYDKESVKRKWDCLKRFTKWFDSFNGMRLAYSVNFHSWSTSRPIIPHSHFHVIFLSMGLIEGRRKTDRVEIKLPIHEVDLLTIKEKWSEIVATEFKCFEYFPALDLDHENLIDIHFSFIPVNKKNIHRIIHKLKYVKRRPTVDLAEFYKRHEFDWLPYPEFARDLVEYKNPTICLGFWRQLSLYANRCLEPAQHICPICGDKIVPTGRILDKMPPDIIFIGRKGNVFRRIEVRKYDFV